MKLAYSDYRKPSAKVEISIAPLIDVMFLLLIFFMVATVFPENDGVVIEKPNMASADKIGKTPIRVVITNDKIFYVDGRAVTLDEAVLVVREKMSGEKGETVMIEADKGVSVGVLGETLDKLKEAGVQNFALSANRKPFVDK